jgi:hypothetical protein
MLDIFELIFMTLILLGAIMVLSMVILDLIQLYLLISKHAEVIWRIIERKIDDKDSGN